MQRWISLYCLFVVSQTIAARVQWDCFSLSSEGGNEYRLSYYADWGNGYPDGVMLRAETCLKVSDAEGNGRVCVEAVPNDTVLAFSGNWAAAEKDDVASASSTRNQSSYFHHAYIDETPENQGPGVRSDYSIKRNADTAFYLMFAVEDANYRPWAKENQEVFYGWVELEVASSGELMLLSSAIDLDGGPMIVGGGSAIPEPTAALLLLAGGALLALRRQRGAP